MATIANAVSDHMSRMNFGDEGCASKRNRARREVFLVEMDQVVPWPRPVALINFFRSFTHLSGRFGGRIIATAA